MRRPGYVGDSASAVSAVDPERVPLPGFAPCATVTLPAKPVAVFPCPSSAVTCTAGVMDAPAAVLVGCTVKDRKSVVQGKMVDGGDVGAMTLTKFAESEQPGH